MMYNYTMTPEECRKYMDEMVFDSDKAYHEFLQKLLDYGYSKGHIDGQSSTTEEIHWYW